MSDPAVITRRTPGETDALRKRIRREYLSTVERITAAMFRIDPVGINFETNTDEYRPEAETVVARLYAPGHAASPAEVRRVVAEEFAYWFGPEYAADPALLEPTTAEVARILSDARHSDYHDPKH